MGRPSRPVELILAVLILKEMYGLTNREALGAVDFNSFGGTRWTGSWMSCIYVRLRAMKELDTKAYEAIPEGIRRRHGEEENYADARKEDRARRLTVAARDAWRLVNRCERHERVTGREEWPLMKRLLDEPCEIRTAPMVEAVIEAGPKCLTSQIRAGFFRDVLKPYTNL
jgi:hypothetical protein